MTSLAPIVLFVYNRPHYLNKTLHALSNNELVDRSILYIYADGPKCKKDLMELQKIREVRSIIKQINWCKELYIVESDYNKGLANSIIFGVSEVLNKHGKIIVLEDDLITSPYFLKFMNSALDKYQNIGNISMIHGHVYDIRNLPNTFFLYKSGNLGWGTWDSIWNKVNFSGQKLLNEIYKNKLAYEFNFNGSFIFTEMLKNQVNKGIDSWAIRFYAHCVINKLLTLYPGKTLVKHIGDIGSHCKAGGKSASHNKKIHSCNIKLESIPVEQSNIAYNKFIKFYKKIYRQRHGISYKTRIRRFISKILLR